MTNAPGATVAEPHRMSIKEFLLAQRVIKKKLYQKQYRDKNKAKRKEKDHNRYLANRDEIIARNKNYVATHQEQRREYDKCYYQKKKAIQTQQREVAAGALTA